MAEGRPRQTHFLFVMVLLAQPAVHHHPSFFHMDPANSISDVELLEFLVGYSNSGGGGSGGNVDSYHQQQQQCSGQLSHHQQAHPPPHPPQGLYQPWRSSHPHNQACHHPHLLQQQQQQHHLQQPVHIQIPATPPSPLAGNDPSPKRRRRTRVLPRSEAVERGMLERWEPGEIVDEKSISGSSSSETSFCTTPPPPPSSSSQEQDRSSERRNSLSEVYLVGSPSSSSSPPKKRGPRPKVLTPLERRQKRLDANDRERERMGKLNSAFDSLRHLLPRHGNDRELSKFETIQIAKNYIRALNDMLVETDPYHQSEQQQGSDFYVS